MDCQLRVVNSTDAVENRTRKKNDCLYTVVDILSMRIRQSGVLGVHDGFYWTENAPAANDIDSDNDGVMVPVPNYLVDLSKLASNALGKQASMMASYKLHSIRVGIRPADDTVDNDQAAVFGGRHFVRLMTDHMKKALQMARKTEKALEGLEIDGDSLFLSSDKDYSGFRYSWHPQGHFDVIEHVTTCPSTINANNFWDLETICTAYDAMTLPSESNALFNGRAPGIIQNIWECGWSNKPWAGMHHGGDDSKELHLDVVPLVAGNINYSSVNEPGAVDDDYYVWMEVDFTVGGSF